MSDTPMIQLTDEQKAAVRREYFAEIGRRGGMKRSRKKTAAILKNMAKAKRVSRALARQKKKA